MNDEGYIEAKGVVLEGLPGTTFRVLLDKEVFGVDDYKVLATISGRMRKNRVRILPGDRVTLEISLFDLQKGRIVFRDKV